MTAESKEVQLTFDYAALPAETANRLRQLADRIRRLGITHTQTVVEIGRELRAAKMALPHGGFCQWLAAEFCMTERSARNYMQAATWVGGKTEIVSVLPPTSLYILAAPSTPQSVQDEVIARVQSGETLATATIRSMVAKAKEEEARSQKAQRQRREVEAAKTERWQREPEEQDQRTKDAAAFIRDRLGSELSKFVDLTENISWYTFHELLKEAAYPTLTKNPEAASDPTPQHEPERVDALEQVEPIIPDEMEEVAPAEGIGSGPATITIDAAPVIDKPAPPEDPPTPEQVDALEKAEEVEETKEIETVEPDKAEEVVEEAAPAEQSEHPELLEEDLAALRRFREHAAKGGAPWIGIREREWWHITDDTIDRLIDAKLIVPSPKLDFGHQAALQSA